MHVHVQTHQIVYVKYGQFFVYQLYFKKAEKNLSLKVQSLIRIHCLFIIRNYGGVLNVYLANLFFIHQEWLSIYLFFLLFNTALCGMCVSK